MTARCEEPRPTVIEPEVHPLICERWSPRAFDDRPVEPEKLRTIFNAARWAPSSFNEQPWRFMVATLSEPDWLERLQGYLSSGNRWAKQAPVLIVSAYRTRFSRNDRPNRMALRDLGAAEENMFLQAFDLGLVMHQMAGFEHQRLKEDLLPEGFEPGAMSAIGYPAGPEDTGDGVKRRDRTKRRRKPPEEVVFGGNWGEPAHFLD